MERLKIPVDEYTSPAPYTVDRGATVPRVRDIMRKHGVRHVPVLDGKHAVGIISDRDLRMLDHLEGADAVTAGDVMTKEPYTVESGTSLEEVVFAMSLKKVGSAVVCDHGDVVGIFTSTDALNALVEILRGELPQ
jgi:acetoin utilization protein AcuB